MKYLLDTDVIINYLKKIKSIEVGENSELTMSVMTLAELLYGIEKSPKSTQDRKILDDFISTLSVSILEVSKGIIERFSKLKVALEQKGARLEDFDLLIASTALEHDLTLVTGNKRHFSRILRLKLA